MMETPFPKSMSFAKKYDRLLKIVEASDTMGILINADPDSMASAMALKRIFWKKARRVMIYRVNSIKRADNRAFVKFLTVDQKHIRQLKRSAIRKWALLDSQPNHHRAFMDYQYNIIIDHHPITDHVSADFLDIQEDYGANSSIMTEYLKAGKIKPSPKLATALFYGIKTDTHNFVRATIHHDMDAFKYLYRFTSMRMLSKIESAEMTRRMLSEYRRAMERLTFIKDIAFVHMERVDNPDLLVLIADFFMKIAEIRWSIVSGVYKDNLVVILRNASFYGDAGKKARQIFKRWKGSSGGHKNAARAEIPLENILDDPQDEAGLGILIKKILRDMK
ncbi:MAG: DHH family phosphoesterase [Desulfobacteraceae bacterium]|jgi:nanoRNase/pAp phosphatase (c-di-AMP/oligoRNAs hydrolase)|nr:DHH family phosphoesterase [Desulfobacteraceae bacterium]